MSRRGRIYLVANSHLDTQWRWTVRDVIRQFLPRTVREVRRAFERFPHYVQTFEGSFRYLLLEEYHPEGFAEVRQWIRDGRWHPAGSMLESPDVNIPAPESLLRHVLLGSRYFRERLGRPTTDLFLPDCFGFTWALPTIARHCGLVGFSSSKYIKWGRAPFDIGIWEGPDGSELLTVLNPGGYGETLDEVPSRSQKWVDRVDAIGSRTGAFVGYGYFGVGDRGGAPDDESLGRLEEAVASADGPLEVRPAPSDAFYADPEVAQVADWPRHRGEMLLTAHGSGCLTSQAALKRWNRRNEERALAAEATSAMADWLGSVPYPAEALREAWTRFLWHQHHDDVTGTSIPAAYDITWQDQVAAAFELEGRLLDALEGVAAGLDTDVEGSPVVLFNPLAIPRRDVIEIALPAPGDGSVWELTGPEGELVPTQWQETSEGRGLLLALPSLPPLGAVVFDLREAQPTAPPADGPEAGPDWLDNGRLRVTIDARGRIARIEDRDLEKDLLAEPLELELLPDRSRRWPAWEILWKDVRAQPKTRAADPADVRVVEAGPVRATLEVSRRVGRSRVVERISLTRDSPVVEWRATIDWRERRRLLKARFPLAPSNETATFDLGLGAIRRGNANPEKYEVPAQHWVDLTDAGGGFGVTILSESRMGWDKPDDGTLRLSILRSPRARWRFRHQATQDHGRHQLGWALYGHSGGDVPAAASDRAARFARPPLAFRARRHGGHLGRTFSFLDLEGSRGVAVQCLKQAEDGDDLVLRVRETSGEADGVLAATLPSSLASIRRATGDERAGDELAGDGATLRDRVPRFGLRTYRLRFEPPTETVPRLASTPVRLPLDTPAASFHDDGRPVRFDRSGRSFPGELVPPGIEIAGARLDLGAVRPEEPHCVSCRGQSVELPDAAGRPGAWISFLATAAEGERRVPFTLETDEGPRTESIAIPGWRTPIARRHRREAEPEITHRERIAWVGTHRHDRRLRDEPHALCYLFAFRLEAGRGARTLRLPEEPTVRIFAATVADGAERRLEPLRSPENPL